VRVGWTDHLVALVGRSEAAAARLATGPPDRRAALALRARRDVARLSVRLDASPLTDETAGQVDAGLAPATAGSGPAPAATGGWAGALRLDTLPSQDVAAVEYANLLACADIEPDVAGFILERPLDALVRLHAEICRGLVDPALVGRPRRTEQAISDGAQGRLLYRAAEPDQVPGLLAGLEEWVRRSSAGLPALVVAGVVHERLLEWQPFEAGNGRLARAASRVLLRARGLDPDGLAVPERLLAADRGGYFAEVAATKRRRGDLTLWLERYGEALAAALETAADAVGTTTPTPSPPKRALVLAEELGPDGVVTLPDYAERAGVSPATARVELDRLAAAGVLRVQPHSRGSRYQRVPDARPGPGQDPDQERRAST
jgi:hypothetical protein